MLVSLLVLALVVAFSPVLVVNLKHLIVEVFVLLIQVIVYLFKLEVLFLLYCLELPFVLFINLN
jgi:hypothetical protein